MRATDIAFLERWVLERTGNVMRQLGRMPVTARVEGLAASLEMSVQDLVAVLREGLHPQIEVRVMEAVLNAETLFFRDVRFFDGVCQNLLPGLLDARRGERRLRIWSGACATGQEVYSLCILLREHFSELLDWEVEIVASDFSPRRIRRARRGRYSQHEVNRGLPARYLVRYFDKVEGEWVIERALRESIEFKVQNLMEPWRLVGLFDIILLRNVLIYFQDPLRASIVERARAHLRDDGFLLLGSAEVPRYADDRFVRTEPPIPGCFKLRRRTPLSTESHK